MSLTKADLKSISVVVKTTVQPMLDDLDDNLSISTAQGFAEVHKKINGVETRLSSKIDKLARRHSDTLGLVLQHETRLSKFDSVANPKT